MAIVGRTSSSIPVIDVFPLSEEDPQKLENFPNELLFMIFSELNVREQQTASYACRRFRVIAKDLENVRVLKRAINLALGNLIKNVDPEVTLLHKLANQIFDIFTIYPIEAKEELGNILGRIFKLFPSWQNHILSTLIEAWVVKKKEKPLLKLIDILYRHPNLSNGNRLHLLTLANTGKILEPFASSLMKLTTPLSDTPTRGKLLAAEETFKRQEVKQEHYQSLIISKDNTFEIGEIVAVDHRGNLIGNRQKLFLGVVRDIFEMGGETWYQVYTHCPDGIWIDDVTLTAGMIGKVPFLSR